VAALGSAAFFVVAPCVVAGLVPWWLTGWEVEHDSLPLQVLGGVLIAAGASALVYSFARFVSEGRGTPAPVAPTERLVVGGLYRYVRNPMYVALLAVILGQAMVFGQPLLLTYAAGVFLLVYAFVRLYEEPKLARTYGEQYEQFRREIPRWLPRPRALRR
jgi:protein-S-isoprenylcysteine O-methyltransferase Ste14